MLPLNAFYSRFEHKSQDARSKVCSLNSGTQQLVIVLPAPRHFSTVATDARNAAPLSGTIDVGSPALFGSMAGPSRTVISEVRVQSRETMTNCTCF